MRWILPLLVLAGPVVAQERPAVMPTRDVDVIYAIAPPQPGAPPMAQRMRWSVTSGRLRVDPPAQDLYMVVDYRAKRMMVVRPADKAVLDMEAPGTGVPGAPANGPFTRQTGQTIAGLSCTNWQTVDASGAPAVLCLTADGVMLQASREGQLLIQATSVSYGPQDENAFSVPAGYQHITPPKP